MGKMKSFLAYTNPLLLLGVPVTVGIFLGVAVHDSMSNTTKIVKELIK